MTSRYNFIRVVESHDDRGKPQQQTLNLLPYGQSCYDSFLRTNTVKLHRSLRLAAVVTLI